MIMFKCVFIIKLIFSLFLFHHCYPTAGFYALKKIFLHIPLFFRMRFA